MANYVDASCQTIWAGLTKSPIVRPDTLFAAPDTTTPPDDMITGKPQVLENPSSNMQPLQTAPALLDRRTHRPKLVTRISLPPSQLHDDGLLSPPPTNALLSPLPAANKLHAGHTPKMPRALSPGELHDNQSSQPRANEEVQPSRQHPLEKHQLYTPEEDVGLTGPLSLPALPTTLLDGADEHIALDALDEELRRIAREQERFSKLRDAPEPTRVESTDDHGSPNRKASAGRRYSTEDAPAPDGVILKSPRMNFGAPLGQVPRRRSEPDQHAS